jgi:hypothetical protein
MKGGCVPLTRIVRPLALALLLLLPLAAGILAGLAWRLAGQPLSLAAVQGPLERLAARGIPFGVRFADPALAWSIEQGTFMLTVQDLELRSRTGQLVLGAPQAGIAVDAAALLLQRALVPVELALDLPRMTLARTAPRRLELDFGGQLAALPLAQATGSGGLESLLARVPEAGDPRLQRLAAVRIAAPMLRFEDAPSGRAFTAGAAVLRLERDDAGWRASLTAEVGDGAAPGRMVLSAAPGASAGLQRIRLAFDGMPAQALGDLVPSLPQDALQGRLSGRLESSLSLPDLEPGSGSFRLTATGVTLRWPDMFADPPTVERVEVAGEVAAGWRTATIHDAAAASGETRLGATGELVLDAGTLRLGATLEAAALDAGTIARFWPLRKAARARQWFAAHVGGGRAGQARLGLVLPLPWAAGGGGPVAADLAFGFSGATVAWLDGMAPAQEVAGDALLRRDRLDFTLRGGRIGEVELRSGRLAIEGTDVRDAPPRLGADLALAGPLRAALQVLDGGRLRLPTKAGVDPARASGRVEGRLGLDLPLKRGLTREEIRFRLDAALDDAGLDDAFQGLAARAAELTVAGDEKELAARGTLAVAGVPARLDWRERLARGGGWRREIMLAGTVDAAAAGRLAVPWPAFLGGRVDASATVTVPWRGPRRIGLDLDLGPAAVSLPALGLDKPPGAPGRVAGMALQPAPDRLDVERLAVTLPGLGLEAAAGVRVSPFDWWRLTVERLQVAGSELAAHLVKQDDGTISGQVRAARLDLRPWRERMATGGNAKRPALPPLDVTLEAEALLLGGAPLEAVTGRLQRSGQAWGTIRLDARLAGGGKAMLDYRGDERGGQATLRASDGGRLLEAAGIRQTRIQGGRLRLDTGLDAAGTVTGEFRLRDFTLLDSPLMARIFTLASFQGIASALSGRGIPVDRLTVPFTWRGQEIGIEDARLQGSQIGARADGKVDLARRTIALDGTVAPAYGLNWVLGQVPLVGPIMRGQEADAALAATFGVRGDLAAPEITVNPLAALVPGVIRDLFRDLGAEVPEDSLERDRQ